MSGDYQHVEFAADVAHGDFEPKYRSGSETIEAAMRAKDLAEKINKALAEHPPLEPPPDNHPPMPADFWPAIHMTAIHGGGELGFTVSADEMAAGWPDGFYARLDALRRAIWVAKHWTNDHLRVADLRNT